MHAPPATPDVSVVVPSHERPLRLRWLLNALEEQTLAPERWELVVVHDSRAEETEQLLETHPIADRVALRHLRLAPGTGTPPRQRNEGIRLARAERIAFTDDDCRPEADWLATLLAASLRAPAAVVQGRTLPDPYETDVLAAPHSRTIRVDPPPGPNGQTCNILYPRSVLDAIGGFDEKLATAGEDADLLWRAIESGAPHVGEPSAVVYHAVESFTAYGLARVAWKWRSLPLLVRRHPALRSQFTLRVFWKPAHARLLLALAGAVAVRRAPAAVVLAAPYARLLLDREDPRPRSRLRAAVEAPGRVVVDVAELAALAVGSARQGTLFL